MKSVLLFLAGLLLGANLVYFLLLRRQPEPVPVAPATAPATAIDHASETAATPAAGTAPAAANGATSPTPKAMPALAPAPAPAVAQAPMAATQPAPVQAPVPLNAPAPDTLLIPVAGIAASQLRDTFGDKRGGNGERTHEALDIMAPRGTPVLAAGDGKVEKLFTSVPGGLTIYQFDPTRTYAYYYAHLDRYSQGLAEGRQLKRGDVIGYVGSTGNASEDAPHLHFAIFVLGPEKHWWQGTAIDPYRLLGGR